MNSELCIRLQLGPKSGWAKFGVKMGKYAGGGHEKFTFHIEVCPKRIEIGILKFSEFTEYAA